jgi:hypothetical protein
MVKTATTMTGGQHAVACPAAASRIVGRLGAAGRSLNMPKDPLARPTCRPEAYDFVACLALGVAVRDAGWACPRENRPGSSRPLRSRSQLTALARSSKPEGRMH